MSLHQQSYTYYLDNFESIYDQFKEDVNKLASAMSVQKMCLIRTTLIGMLL